MLKRTTSVRQRDLVALLLLCSMLLLLFCVFIVVPWVGLLSVIVTFPGHTHLCFGMYQRTHFWVIYMKQ